MQSTELLLGLALLVLGVDVTSTEGIVCPPDICGAVRCAQPEGCKGGIVTGGFCGCCQVCAKVKSESCGGHLLGTNMGTCDTGLYCQEGSGLFGTCKSAKK